jgi:hypothetical protein
LTAASTSSSQRADERADYFAITSARNPARRIGTVDDIAYDVVFAMTSTFRTVPSALARRCTSTAASR